MYKKKTYNKKNRFKKIYDSIKESPINYFSDLFIVSMVLSWIFVLIVMAVMAIYSTIALSSTDMWSDVVNLVTIPLSAGGAVWMIKNSVQHAILNKKGKKVPYDFPKVEVNEECSESEPLFEYKNEDD